MSDPRYPETFSEALDGKNHELGLAICTDAGLMEKLLDRKIINGIQKQALKAIPTNYNRSTELLSMLEHCDDRLVQAFCDCLEETNNRKALNLILSGHHVPGVDLLQGHPTRHHSPASSGEDGDAVTPTDDTGSAGDIRESQGSQILESQLTTPSDDAGISAPTSTMPEDQQYRDAIVTSNQSTVENTTSTIVIPEEEGPICGMTSFGERVFVLRSQRMKDHLESYDVDVSENRPTSTSKGKLTINGLRGVADMAASEQDRRLYISDFNQNCLHVVQVQDNMRIEFKKWPVKQAILKFSDEPYGLSVTNEGNVLVTCTKVGGILEFTKLGKVSNVIKLDVTNPNHAVQMPTCQQQYVVCYGVSASHGPEHGVCIVDVGGRVAKKRYVGGAAAPELSSPCHVAVDRNGVVFVVDFDHGRVVALSPDLDRGRVVCVSRSPWKPFRLYLGGNKLYVAENLVDRGRVVVVDVSEFTRYSCDQLWSLPR